MNAACLYIPDFYVQAVVRSEPQLRGRAVAVVEAAPPPFRVFALNEAARRAGAEPGMSRVEVAVLPGLEMRRRSPAAEISAHAALCDLARSFSPRFEAVAVDVVTLDLAGLTALLGPPEKIASGLRQGAYELGLEAHVALAPHPDAARLAARGFAGITLIGAGEEADRLGELPVAVLEPAPEVLETLRRWGIRTFRALAALPAAELSERLGQEGVRLHRLARGAALRALVPAPEPLHFEEAMDLDYPVSELDPLAFILGRLLNQLCARLAARGRATQELRLVVGLEGGHEDRQIENRNSKFETRNSEAQPTFVNGTTQGDLRISDSESRVLRLPVPTCDSRLLLKLWLLDLEARPPRAPVCKISMAAEPTRPRLAQGDLFLPRAPDPQKLELTLARLRGVVGEGNAGSPELLDTHRPDAFQVAPFNVTGRRELKVKSRKLRVKGQRPADELASGSPESRVPNPEPRPLMTLRLFRPPLPARVELRDGQPFRMEAHRVRGGVTSAAGPWRTSGDWWTDHPWERDEWDVEIQFVVRGPSSAARVEGRKPLVKIAYLYRIYCDLTDGRWFLEGLYD